MAGFFPMQRYFGSSAAQLNRQIFGLVGLDYGILNPAQDQDGHSTQVILRTMIVGSHPAHQNGAGPSGIAVEQQMHRHVGAIRKAGEDKLLAEFVAAGGGASERG